MQGWVGRGWGSLGRGAAPRPVQCCMPSASHAPLPHSARAVASSAEPPRAQEQARACRCGQLKWMVCGEMEAELAGASPRSLLHPRQPGMSRQDACIPPPWPLQLCLSFPTVEQAVGHPLPLQSCPSFSTCKTFRGGGGGCCREVAAPPEPLPKPEGPQALRDAAPTFCPAASSPPPPAHPHPLASPFHFIIAINVAIKVAGIGVRGDRFS